MPREPTDGVKKANKASKSRRDGPAAKEPAENKERRKSGKKRPDKKVLPAKKGKKAAVASDSSDEALSPGSEMDVDDEPMDVDEPSEAEPQSEEEVKKGKGTKKGKASRNALPSDSEEASEDGEEPESAAASKKGKGKAKSPKKSKGAKSAAPSDSEKPSESEPEPKKGKASKNGKDPKKGTKKSKKDADTEDDEKAFHVDALREALEAGSSKLPDENIFNPDKATNNCVDLAFNYVTDIPVKEITKAFGGLSDNPDGRNQDDIKRVGKKFNILFADKVAGPLEKHIEKHGSNAKIAVALLRAKVENGKVMKDEKTGETLRVGHCLAVSGGTMKSEANWTYEDFQMAPGEDVSEAVRSKALGKAVMYMWREDDSGDEDSDEDSEDSGDAAASSDGGKPAARQRRK
jgi:hypothetical protein